MQDLFPRMCERSRFNRVSRNLIKVTEQIRLYLNTLMNGTMDDLRIVDRLLLQVCVFGRACFCRLFSAYGADYGVCASKKLTYYGYKVHAMCTTNGFIMDFLLSAAAADDRDAAWELVETYNCHLLIIG